MIRSKILALVAMCLAFLGTLAPLKPALIAAQAPTPAAFFQRVVRGSISECVGQNAGSGSAVVKLKTGGTYLVNDRNIDNHTGACTY